jgi:hypothetical protein
MSLLNRPDAPPRKFVNSFDPVSDAANTIVRLVGEYGRQYLPDVADLLPFRNGWRASGHAADGRITVRVMTCPGLATPLIKQFNVEELELFGSGLTKAIEAAADQQRIPFDAVATMLGENWYSVDNFTYAGTWGDLGECGEELMGKLRAWLDKYVIGHVMELNRRRVLRAIPSAISLDLPAITGALWILESEGECVQGTAFALRDVGLVTCEHVLARDLVAFRAEPNAPRFPVTVVASSSDLDLAILSIDAEFGVSLARGSGDRLAQLDSICVAGFPNHGVGASAHVNTGHVSGFRPVGGIRRILTDAPIVRGMSGGPAIVGAGEVVGVIVTGAERIETSDQTEKHGIVPIEALRFLGTNKLSNSAGR